MDETPSIVRESSLQSVSGRLGWRYFAVAIAWLSVATVVFSLGFAPLRMSTDEWWHLKTGKYIVENGYRPPTHDVFTYTAASYEWHNHEWLSQVGMYQVWRWGRDRVIGEWRAVITLKSLILVATYLLLGLFLARRAGEGVRGHTIAIFLTLLAAAAGKRMMWPRPPIVSNFLFVFFLYIMWLHRSGRIRTRWLFVLPALMPLWANLHGGFLLGGMVVAAYFAGELATYAWGRWGARRDSESLRPGRSRVQIYLVLGIFCGLGSLLNPWGYHLYLLPGRVMKCKELMKVLGELEPPVFIHTWAFTFLLIVAGVGLGVLLGRTTRGRVRLALWAGAGVLALVSELLSFAHATRAYEMTRNFSSFIYEAGLYYAPVHVLFLTSVCVWIGMSVALAFGLRSRRWPPLADWLLAAFFAWQATLHMRHMILFGLAGAPLLAWMLGEWWASERTSLAVLLRWTLTPLSVAIGIWLIFMPVDSVNIFLHGQFGQSQFNRNRLLFQGEEMRPRAYFGKPTPPRSDYPIEAVHFILAAKLPPRMFNNNNLAGYLVWALSPEHYKVFTDSRFDIFGQDFLLDEQSVAGGVTAEVLEEYYKTAINPTEGYRPWTEVVEEYGINWLFLENDANIIKKLEWKDSGWAKIYPNDAYPDYSYCIWLKRTPENQPWIEKYERRTEK